MAICHEYKCCKFANFMNKKKQQQLCKLSWNVVTVGEVGGDVSWHWRLENEGTEASPWTIKEGENAFDRAVWRSQGLGTSGCSWCYRHHFGRLIISCRYQFSASMRHRSKGRLPQIGEIGAFFGDCCQKETSLARSHRLVAAKFNNCDVSGRQANYNRDLNDDDHDRHLHRHHQNEESNRVKLCYFQVVWDF